MRERWRTRFGRSMARPVGGGPHVPEPGPRGRVILGWIGAGLVLAIVAFIVGRPSGDAGDGDAARSAAPSASASALPITFGRALDAGTLEAVEPTGTYHRGDTFAYSVTLAEPAGADAVYVRVDRVNGTRETVQDWTDGEQIINPGAATVGFEVAADALLDAFGPGRYEMRMSLTPNGEVLAAGSFELVEDPVAS
jgi:hypothetical protein